MKVTGDVERIGVHAGERFALQLVLSGDPALYAIVRLSLLVSLGGRARRPHRHPVRRRRRAHPLSRPRGLTVILNALMGLPPVVVGLAVYLLLSRSGPLGSWGLLFTPTAMVVAQTVLIAPIITRSRARPSRICGPSTATSSPPWMSARSDGSRRCRRRALQPGHRIACRLRPRRGGGRRSSSSAAISTASPAP